MSNSPAPKLQNVMTSLVTDRDIKLVLGPDFAYPRDLKVRDAMGRRALSELLD